MTGLFEDQFVRIFDKVEHKIALPRSHQAPPRTARIVSTSLTPHLRLLLVIYWLRHYPRYSVLAHTFGISQAQVHREIYHILPILYEVLDEITLPPVLQPKPPFMAVGAVDCAVHHRKRVHPGQAQYYRGDKRAHFLLGNYRNIISYCS